jgi:hypothetical protein
MGSGNRKRHWMCAGQKFVKCTCKRLKKYFLRVKIELKINLRTLGYVVLTSHSMMIKMESHQSLKQSAFIWTMRHWQSAEFA